MEVERGSETRFRGNVVSIVTALLRMPLVWRGGGGDAGWRGGTKREMSVSDGVSQAQTHANISWEPQERRGSPPSFSYILLRRQKKKRKKKFTHALWRYDVRTHTQTHTQICPPTCPPPSSSHPFQHTSLPPLPRLPTQPLEGAQTYSNPSRTCAESRLQLLHNTSGTGRRLRCEIKLVAVEGEDEVGVGGVRKKKSLRRIVSILLLALHRICIPLIRCCHRRYRPQQEGGSVVVESKVEIKLKRTKEGEKKRGRRRSG